MDAAVLGGIAVNYMLLIGALVLSLGANQFAHADAIVDTDFGTADTPVLTRGDRPNPNVTGVMSGDWRDDTSWAPDVRATWELLEEEGRRFVRGTVTEIDTGRYQLAHELPPVSGETFFRLSFTARSMIDSGIEVGIRDSGVPYQFHWNTRPAVSASWRDYSYDFRLGTIDQAVGFWINIDGAGQVDLARFRLDRLTRDDYIEELKREYGETGPKNCLRTSCFPLGLQSGWSLNRDSSDGDDVTVAPDPDVVGPSGAPSLRIETSEPTGIYSAPFGLPLAFQKHTASVYVRGTGSFTMSVRADGQQKARQTWQLEGADRWQRVSLSFDPTLMTKAYILSLECNQTFWLDALQVQAAPEPGEYASQLPCEVALACPESDASAARIQFGDEPAQVRYYVTGDTSGARLRCRVVNAYGDEKLLEPVDLSDEAGRSGTVQYDAFPDRPLGTFRVEAWVEDTAGTRVSTFNELVLYRLPRPRYWGQDAPDSPFGVHTNSTTRHNLMAKAIGANWTRLHDAGLQYLGWYHLEREPGKWTFCDKEINRYRRDHIKVLGELGTAPEWASYFPGKAHNGYFDRFYQPKRLEDYANYVRTVTERYKGVIDAYDVWNEPWIHAWWGVGYDETRADRGGYVPSEDPQGDFARLMRTAYETAKSVDPNITILGFNSTTGGGGSDSINGREWTQGVLDAGGLENCDVICYHQYIGGKPGYPGDVVEVGFETATGPVSEKLGKLPKPVWMTEGSAGRDTIGDGFYNYTLPYPNPEDVIETSDRLCRYVTSVLAQGTQRLFLYSMHCHGAMDSSSNFRAVVTREGYLHPCGAAHGVLAWYLEDTHFVKMLTVAEDVFAYVFEATDGSRSVAAVSPKSGHAEWALPEDDRLSIVDIFGNPLTAGSEVGDTLLYITGPMSATELEAAVSR